MKSRVEYLVEKLELLPHPEGGYYREVYRSTDRIAHDGLPDRFQEDRVFVTDIYYLLSGDAISRLHRIRADELWHFFEGCPLTVHVLEDKGNYSPFTLGPHLDEGQCYQSVVPAGAWFGATTTERDSYSLVGCTVAPGFEFQDLEIADRDQLLSLYPQHRQVIERLTA